MSAASEEQRPSINLAEVTEIELFVVRRMKQLSMGDHHSFHSGSGFNLVGLRDWQPGDPLSSVDWAQSSLTNFSPLITRQFEQDSVATVLAVVDGSLSTRCGARGDRISTAIIRSLAAIGMSAVHFQDPFGVLSFDGDLRPLATVPPRSGRAHVLHCLEQFERSTRALDTAPAKADLASVIAATLRQASLVPVVSDFLFAGAPAFIEKLAMLNLVHDVFLVCVDASFAFYLPEVSSGWIEIADVESGEGRVISRDEFARLAQRVASWQDQQMSAAREHGIDSVRITLDRWQMEAALAEFVAARRLRKVGNMPANRGPAVAGQPEGSAR